MKSVSRGPRFLHKISTAAINYAGDLTAQMFQWRRRGSHCLVIAAGDVQRSRSVIWKNERSRYSRELHTDSSGQIGRCRRRMKDTDVHVVDAQVFRRDGDLDGSDQRETHNEGYRSV